MALCYILSLQQAADRAVYLRHREYFKLAAAGVIINWQNEIL